MTKLSEEAKLDHRHQYNYDPFTLTPSEHHYHFPLVTAKDLAQHRTRPRQVRMLASDFIHDSLYNPHYGYFSRQAVLLPHLEETLQAEEASRAANNEEGSDSPGKGQFPFNRMRNEGEFMRAVQLRYEAFEKKIEDSEAKKELAAAEKEARSYLRSGIQKASAEGLEQAQKWGKILAERDANQRVMESDVMAMAARQVWHTPTELFKPHYAEAVARYLVSEYKLKLFPYEDLIIYEIGAGSGTLAEGVLNYLQKEEPAVYARARYRIIEISDRLAEQQTQRLSEHVANGKVEVNKKSILDWDVFTPDPCFIIALEVLDNLAHDVVRYDTASLEPYQAIVSIDETGDMHELWEPARDPKILRYLSILNGHDGSTSQSNYHIGVPRRLRYIPGPVRRLLNSHFPFYPNLTEPHFLPTSSLQLLDVLREHFPLHRLVVSDFSSLPDAVEGLNGPVVQTRFKGTMIPVTTYRVLQGFFDIFFPTNFEELRRMYNSVMGPVPNMKDQANGSGLSDHARATPLSQSSSLRPDYFTSDVRQSSNGGLVRRQSTQVLSHADFLRRYAKFSAVQLKDGTNPMLSWYANASWLLS